MDSRPSNSMRELTTFLKQALRRIGSFDIAVLFSKTNSEDRVLKIGRRYFEIRGLVCEVRSSVHIIAIRSIRNAIVKLLAISEQ